MKGVSEALARLKQMEADRAARKSAFDVDGLVADLAGINVATGIIDVLDAVDFSDFPKRLECSSYPAWIRAVEKFFNEKGLGDYLPENIRDLTNFLAFNRGESKYAVMEFLFLRAGISDVICAQMLTSARARHSARNGRTLRKLLDFS